MVWDKVKKAESMTQVLEEVWLIGHLTINLIGEMGQRIMWLWMSVRFALYVLLLCPAFLRAAFIYTISDFIKKSIVYGPHRRNYLDLYLPTPNAFKLQKQRNAGNNQSSSLPQSNNNNNNANVLNGNSNTNNNNNAKAPVVVFFAGGAWMIGYKAWGAFMGMLLAQLGVLFVAPDHRNFPQGTITDMMNDVSNAIKWTFENIENYGGDKNSIFIVSQSAGAHISCLVLLKHAYYHAKKRYLNKISNLNDNNNDLIDNNNSNQDSTNIDINEENNENNENNSNNTLTSSDIMASTDNNSNNNENEKIKRKNKKRKLVTNKWDPLKLKAYIGIAGPYNLVELTDYWNEKGLYTNVLLHIMNGNFKKYSPIYQLYHHFKIAKNTSNNNDNNNDNNKNNNYNNNNEMGGGSVSNLRKKHDIMKGSYENEKYEIGICPMYLFHGSADDTVPVKGTKSFYNALKEFNINIDLKIYPNKSHTGPIVEDPIEGNDILVRDVLKIIYPNRNLDNIVQEIEDIMRGNLKMPKFLVDLARIVCPF